MVAFNTARDFTPRVREKIKKARFHFLDIVFQTDFSDCRFDIKKEPISTWQGDQTYIKRLKRSVKSRHFKYPEVELNYEDFFVCK